MSSVSNPSENASTKRKWNMTEIDETDEILEDVETLIQNPELKESKLRKHIIRNDKAVFHSGDYFKEKDMEKKMRDRVQDEIEAQSKQMEQKVGKADKKKKPTELPQVKPVCDTILNLETRF